MAIAARLGDHNEICEPPGSVLSTRENVIHFHRRSPGGRGQRRFGCSRYVARVGARDDLLAAARRLSARGSTPFSPAELIAEARAAGSSYPDTTLRTFVNCPMCVNSPDHHAVQYDDLFRVGHGKYCLNGAGVTERAEASPVVPPIVEPVVTPTRPWYWEGNVQSAVVRRLVHEGWDMVRVADTASRERGIDVRAARADETMLVEVKGFPSETYEQGAKQGMPNPNVNTQARHYFADAVLAGLLMRGDNPDDRVVLALPDKPTFSALATRCAPSFATIRIEVWLVKESGAIRECSPG